MGECLRVASLVKLDFLLGSNLVNEEYSSSSAFAVSLSLSPLRVYQVAVIGRQRERGKLTT
jgi:hypothetical protein